MAILNLPPKLIILYSLILQNIKITLFQCKVDPGSNPWGGMTLEWTHTSSPPHPHNFEEEPVLQHGPYDYDKVIVEKTYKK